MTESERTPRVPLSEETSVIALTREAVEHALEEFPTEAASDRAASGSKHDWRFAEPAAPAPVFERQPVHAAWSSTLMHEEPPPGVPAPQPVVQLPHRSIAIACGITVLVGLVVFAATPLVRSVTSGAERSTATNAVSPAPVASRTPPRPQTSAPVATRTSVTGARPSTPGGGSPSVVADSRKGTTDDALARVRTEATDRAARQAAAESARRAAATGTGTASRGAPGRATNAMPPVTAGSPGRLTVAGRAGTTTTGGVASAATQTGPTAALTAPAAIEATATSQARPFPVSGAVAAAPPAFAPSAPAPLAPAPPPSAPSAPVASAPAAPTDRQVIDAVLGRYRTAFNELDAVGAQAIWPTVDRRALERAFGQLERQNVRFSSCAIDVAGAEASARCSGRTIYVPRVGNRDERSENREWQFSLRRAGDQWNISSVQTR